MEDGTTANTFALVASSKINLLIAINVLSSTITSEQQAAIQSTYLLVDGESHSKDFFPPPV